MSAILGLFDLDHRIPHDAIVHRMLAEMSARGSDHCMIWREGQALLAVVRYEWELGADFSGESMIVHDGPLVIAADASVYYRADLLRRLAAAGVAVTGDTPSHLILAAYRAWGDACADHLEGDYAFVLWDRTNRRVFASRDFGGKRTLYHAQIGDTFAVASTMSALLAHPACPRDLDAVALAEAAAGLHGSAKATCYSAVTALPAAWSLSRRNGATSAFPHWEPPVFEQAPLRGARGFDEAADQLREVLVRSVGERMVSGGAGGAGGASGGHAAGSGGNSIWMSGGWDSTAVFGAGQVAMKRSVRRGTLRPVSISYPKGDPGREDEMIAEIAQRWDTPVYWLSIGDIPFFHEPATAARNRDEPFAHAFEMWNRALARGSLTAGSRVALDGNGGDQLFGVSEAYFADLLREGKWGVLAREWRRKGLHGVEGRGAKFFSLAVRPALPAWAVRVVESARRGEPWLSYLERPLPGWIDRDFARRHDLASRGRCDVPRRPGESVAAFESGWYLRNPYFSRVYGAVAAIALEEGVEARSPLYDRRVVEFAARRPRWERSSGYETKSLLRAAMTGLLPATVLAPRPRRTGITGAYFERSMREHFPALFEEASRSMLLAELGIVDPAALRRGLDEYLRTAGASLGVMLLQTVQTELWVRSRLRPPPTPRRGPTERAFRVSGPQPAMVNS